MEISMKIGLRVDNENLQKLKEKFPYWQRNLIQSGTYTHWIEISFSGLTPDQAEAAIQDLLQYQFVLSKYKPA